jgi:hypothetical protein
MAAISLEKVEREAPELVELYKKTSLSLDKIQMRDHVARVCLVLDISASMSDLYDSGKIDELVKKVMALGLQFDDDGQVDCLAFGVNCYDVGSFGMTRGSDAQDYRNCVKTIRARHKLEGGTEYLKALNMLSQKYADSDQPVYVMFVTDGETQDASAVERKIKSMSNEPIFLSFIGLGADYLPELNAIASDQQVSAAPPAKKGFFARLFGLDDQPASRPAPAARSHRAASSGFGFLMGLDEMTGRTVDNAGFFAVKDPAKVDDDLLYSMLMNEYPSWIPEAKKAGILR